MPLDDRGSKLEKRGNRYDERCARVTEAAAAVAVCCVVAGCVCACKTRGKRKKTNYKQRQSSSCAEQHQCQSNLERLVRKAPIFSLAFELHQKARRLGSHGDLLHNGKHFERV